eukprot:gnl/MRDRNA2_/MRDRNA2_88854_c0_seq1.p1 gnl/MRDRNA2_/MRDRNA2_88854_c0~~gnl/MRDRNA2_/MRDRNA2_88854_c0_seq1.p1  ORF type:complete len:267 (+),score=67.57 gnl/MRDRNA2_/MRDRNA2_88854_c0_seq1:102-803(+)
MAEGRNTATPGRAAAALSLTPFEEVYSILKDLKEEVKEIRSIVDAERAARERESEIQKAAFDELKGQVEQDRSGYDDRLTMIESGMSEKVKKIEEAMDEEVKRRRSEQAKISIEFEESAKRQKTDLDELIARLDQEANSRQTDLQEIRVEMERMTGDKGAEEQERKDSLEGLQEDVRAITDHLHGMGLIMAEKFSEVSDSNEPIGGATTGQPQGAMPGRESPGSRPQSRAGVR